ncbi:MAG TPA: hypothetical protein VMB52_06440 [Verrucomicrobiae bacterium]|nr:hypothetical protein [Verrucomicrobiae bacterium]
MRTLHETLKLQHYRHTGKLLHHHHTSYRGLAIVLVFAGVVMVALGMVNRAAAQSFGIQATVLAPVPATAPIIASPAPNTIVKQSSMLVTGSCPLITPQVTVSIQVDGTLAGASACDSNNDFSVPISLSAGDHTLTANTMTITGQYGPGSSPIVVKTVAAAATSAPSVITVTASTPAADLDSNNAVTWAGTITASSPDSLFVHVDWGDGSQNNYTVKPGPQSFTHTYSTTTSHNILLSASDTSGDTKNIQYAAVAYTAAAPQAATTTTSLYSKRTVAGLYSLYFTVVCIASVIWLEAKHTARHTAH